MSGYFYRGKHRKPTHTGRNLAVVASTGALAFPIAGAFTAPEAHADILDEIARCESGGNPNAQNPSSSASGTFQFLDSTWRSLGGSGRAKDASASEQRAMAEKLYAQQGTAPWAASRGCWGGSGGGAVEHRASASAHHSAPARRSAPARKAAPKASAAKVTGGRAADGTGSYVCTTDKLSFDACDPDTLGQVVAYPPYDGHKAAPKVAPKVKKTSWKAAAADWAPAPADLANRDHVGHGSYVCDAAHLPYNACDPDTIGQTVAYPLFDKYR